MANESNLVPNSERTPEERRERAEQMGIASGKARRERKAMKDTLAALLSMQLNGDEKADVELIQDIASLKGKNITVQEAIMLAQIKKAMKGDTRAAEFIRDSSGNKLKEEIQIGGEINNPFADLTTEELKKLVYD